MGANKFIREREGRKNNKQMSKLKKEQYVL